MRRGGAAKARHVDLAARSNHADRPDTIWLTAASGTIRGTLRCSHPVTGSRRLRIRQRRPSGSLLQVRLKEKACKLLPPAFADDRRRIAAARQLLQFDAARRNSRRGRWDLPAEPAPIPTAQGDASPRPFRHAGNELRGRQPVLFAQTPFVAEHPRGPGSGETDEGCPLLRPAASFRAKSGTALYRGRDVARETAIRRK